MRFPRAPAVVLVHVPADHQVRFVDSLADATNVLLPFYSMSAVSLRDAYWHHGMDEAWSHDHVHPGDLGCQVMAELAFRLVASYTFRPHLLAEPVPPLRGDTLLSVDREDDTVCVHSEAMRAYETQEWVLTEEHDKWGLVATKVGATLDVKFTPAGSEEITFQLAYLESYDAAMGSASVVCMEQCSCPTLVVQAQVPGSHVSVEALAKFKVVTSNGACTVRVTLVSGSKFKIIGVMASHHLPDNSKVEHLFHNIKMPGGARRRRAI